MKTFIFLFIVIFGLFFYIFFYAPVDNRRHTPPHIGTIEHISSSTKERVSTLHENTDTITLTTSDTKAANALFQSEKPSAIPEDLTFEDLKALIIEINPHYPKSLIALNSRMHSLLPTQNMQQRFIDHIQSRYQFPLDDTATLQEHFRKHRLLWDWVNLLR